MGKTSGKMYASKEIFLGYVTTVNPDSYTKEGEVTKTVMALRLQKINKAEKRLLPLYKNFPYYSIDATVPISQKRKRNSMFISDSEINMIVESEKHLQQSENKNVMTLLNNHPENNTGKVNKIENELDIYKTKRYVA